MAIDPSFMAGIPHHDDIHELSLSERIDLYNGIKQSLPPHNLKDLNLAEELVLQYMRVKELQTAVLADMDTPANQKAQVANSVSSTLAQLTKLQTDLHTAERFKLIETHLVKTLKDFPELSEAFLDEYERILGSL